MTDRASDGPATGPALDLHIEELILHGFARIDRHQVASAVERELGRLLREPGAYDLLRQGGATEGDAGAQRLDAGSFIVPHDATPEAVGAEVAQAIYHGMRSRSAAAAPRAHAQAR